MKHLGILLMILTLMTASASADTYTQNQVADLMDTSWQAVVAEARQDPLRQQEVTAEKPNGDFKLLYLDLQRECYR